MCGISGYYNYGSSKYYTLEDIRVMNDEQKHRGPDAEGMFADQDNKCGLGHRRLSIVDLSDAANQPMCNMTHSIWISFNGEIYNAAELRSKLEKYKWKTDHSDTEVIVHAYEEWGEQFVNKLRGIFAIAIYDSGNDCLYLYRDRFGVKPLYYLDDGFGLLFSSEIKAIERVRKSSSGINNTALYDYLVFGYTQNNTLFKGIKKVPPSHYLKIKSDKIAMRKYYDILDHPNEDIIHARERDIPEMIRHYLKEAVDIRKMSDVPVGVFLSGGVDSSAIARLYREKDDGSQLKTFCIGYNDELSYKNENKYAEKVADLVGAQFYEKKLNQEDVYKVWHDIVYSLDEPNSDQTCVCQYYVSKLARDNGVKVCMSGEGADELFWGYESWKTFLKWDRILNHMFMRRMSPVLLKMMKASGHETGVYEYFSNSANNRPVYQGCAPARFSNKSINKIMSEDFLKGVKEYSPYDEVEKLYKTFKKKSYENKSLNWMSYVNLMQRLPNDYLMRVDKMSMAVSLEVRVPFLDHKFAEAVLSIPERFKTRDNENKIILKKAMSSLLPKEILWRRKQGFTLPIQDWMDKGLNSIMGAEMSKFNASQNIFNSKSIDELDNMKGLSTYKWSLFALSAWGNIFLR